SRQSILQSTHPATCVLSAFGWLCCTRRSAGWRCAANADYTRAETAVSRVGGGGISLQLLAGLFAVCCWLTRRCWWMLLKVERCNVRRSAERSATVPRPHAPGCLLAAIHWTPTTNTPLMQIV